MKKSKLFIPLFLFFLITSVSVLISNFTIYKVYVQQRTIIDAVAASDYLFEDEYIDRIDGGYPNLSATVIPFKSLIGAYWINKDSLAKGLNLIREGAKDNPYIGFGDMIAANVYQSLAIKDSFEYYTRRSYNKLPNAAVNYALISRMLLWDDKIDSLSILFNQISNRVRDKEVWKVYLTAMVGNPDKVDTTQVKLNALKAKELWPENDQIRLAADYVLYGVESVKQAIEFRRVAIDTFDVNPNLAIESLNKSLKLVPDDLINYETLIEMYFIRNDYKSVIEVYDKLNELNLTELRAPVVEFIAVSLLNRNDLTRGCYLAKALLEINQSLSPGVLRMCGLN